MISTCRRGTCRGLARDHDVYVALTKARPLAQSARPDKSPSSFAGTARRDDKARPLTPARRAATTKPVLSRRHGASWLRPVTMRRHGAPRRSKPVLRRRRATRRLFRARPLTPARRRDDRARPLTQTRRAAATEPAAPPLPRAHSSASHAPVGTALSHGPSRLVSSAFIIANGALAPSVQKRVGRAAPHPVPLSDCRPADPGIV